MLWVYEGLTEYLGFVLSVRSGLMTPEWLRDELAYTAASLDKEPGRSWRPLKDTTMSAPFLYGAPSSWQFWRRGVDFYSEGFLIWLEADVVIRQLTSGARSLDDFCRLFAGGTNGSPIVMTHTLDDVVEILNKIAPYDWRTFLAAKIDVVTNRAPMGGITGSGWQLKWVDTSSDAMKADEKAWEYTGELFSIGIILDKDFVVTDALQGGPAAKSGMGPGMKLLGMNGRRFSVERLREAVRGGKPGAARIELLAEKGEYLRTFQIDWPGGPAYPALARDTSKQDLLSEILKSKANPLPRESK
jgi:predicted metalloprotease with PDZ domain